MILLLICSGGMSTSILVQALEKEAKKHQIENFQAIAIGANQLEEYKNQNFDYILVAPQIKHKFSKMEEFAKEVNKKIYLIPPMEYTPIGAPTLFKNILKL